MHDVAGPFQSVSSRSNPIHTIPPHFSRVRSVRSSSMPPVIACERTCMQATAGKQPGRQTKAGKQIGNHQFAQTCRQEGGQAGKQASKQAGRHMCFCVCCVFRRNFARVRCEDGNIEFPAILGPKSPVFLGIPLTVEHNAVLHERFIFCANRG